MPGTKLLTLPLLFALAAIIARETFLPQEHRLEVDQEMDTYIEDHDNEVDKSPSEIQQDFRPSNIRLIGFTMAWNNNTQRCEEVSYTVLRSGAVVYKFKDHKEIVVV